MSKLISGYLWAWRNWEAGSKSVSTIKKYYPNADIFINVDYEGAVDEYKAICQTNDYTFSKNSFQLGYCGNFGNVNVGRDCWSLESCIEWMDQLYTACKKTDSKYMMLLEEDDFVLKQISILNENFDIAIHPTLPSPIGVYRPNPIPSEFKNLISLYNGSCESPGYGAGGGTIFNRESMIISWEKAKPILSKDYNYLRRIDKIIGWQDYLMQFVMQIGGYQVIQNNKLCEHWEVGGKWNEFEIVTGMKDKFLIESI
jgi:hypothetical protein